MLPPNAIPTNVSKQLGLAILPLVVPNKLGTYYDHLVSITVGKEQELSTVPHSQRLAQVSSLLLQGSIE